MNQRQHHDAHEPFDQARARASAGRSLEGGTMDDAQARPSFIGWLPYIVAATFFMEYLDTTVIATALPQMAHSFGVGPNSLSLGMTAYILAMDLSAERAVRYRGDGCGRRTGAELARQRTPAARLRRPAAERRYPHLDPVRRRTRQPAR